MAVATKRQFVVVILLAWGMVQWLVIHLAFAVTTSGHSSVLQKMLWGCQTAFFINSIDNELIIPLCIGMLIIPLIVGVEYLGAAFAWLKRPLTSANQFPHYRLLSINWKWLIYWPLWVIVLSLTQFAFVFYGGALVIPLLLAFAMGYIAVRQFATTAIE